MKFIKKYDPKHYNYYLDKIMVFIGKHKDINSWIKSLSDAEVIIWSCNIKLLEDNCDEYYEEASQLITLVIKFFMIELDINDQNIELKNSKIKDLIKKFKHNLYREYSNRNNIHEYKEEEYTLLG